MTGVGKDRATIRELAAQAAEIAALPVQEEKRRLWRRLNGLAPERPMVMIDQVCWNEMDVDDELAPALRGCRVPGVRRAAAPHPLPVAAFPGGHGGRAVRARPAGDPQHWVSASRSRKTSRSAIPTNDVVGHRYHNQFETDEDLEKIRLPRVEPRRGGDRAPARRRARALRRPAGGAAVGRGSEPLALGSHQHVDGRGRRALRPGGPARFHAPARGPHDRGLPGHARPARGAGPALPAAEPDPLHRRLDGRAARPRATIPRGRAPATSGHGPGADVLHRLARHVQGVRGGLRRPDLRAFRPGLLRLLRPAGPQDGRGAHDPQRAQGVHEPVGRPGAGRGGDREAITCSRASPARRSWRATVRCGARCARTCWRHAEGLRAARLPAGVHPEGHQHGALRAPAALQWARIAMEVARG